LASRSGACRSRDVVGAAAAGDAAAVQQVAVGLGLERLDDVGDPVGFDEAVVVGEDEDVTVRLADAVVVGAREPRLDAVDVVHPRVPDRGHGVARQVVGALVDDRQVERRVVAGQHAADRGSDLVASVARADDRRDLRHGGVLVGHRVSVSRSSRVPVAGARAATKR
jgi:hypothetical protein